MIAALAALLLSATPAAPVPAPVAVMPFKNLNGDKTLDWMSIGIAETMVTDLKKAGVGIVERDQIDAAIHQIDASGPEDAAAAKIGKLAGANTIVIGSYQRAAKDLRINARFVDVETGAILDTAKATGAAADPFSVQDQIVARLLPKSATPRPKRKTTAKTPEAYRLYAMSLSVVSDADRYGFLQQSVALDPNLTYAADDLAALEKRMAGYRDAANAKLEENDQKLLDGVLDPKRSDADRLASAKSLLQGLQEYKRYNTVFAVATRLWQAQSAPSDVREYASACRVKGLFDLRKDDLLLQAGEQHLKEFPGGANFPKVQAVMQQIIDKRKAWAGRKDEYDKDLADKIGESKPGTPERDYAPCLAARWNSQVNDLMIQGCEPFVAKYASSSDPDVKDQVEAARYFLVEAYSGRGDFDKAKPLADSLADTKEWGEILRTERTTWPTD